MKRRLDFAQNLKLADAVRADQERLSRERQPIEALATGYSRKLGFPVSGSSVRTVIKALGIEVAGKRGRRGQRNGIEIRYTPAIDNTPSEIDYRPAKVGGDQDPTVMSLKVKGGTPPGDASALLRKLADAIDRHGQALLDAEQDGLISETGTLEALSA